MEPPTIDSDGFGVTDDERQKRKNVLDKVGGKDLEKNWQQQDRLEVEAREKAMAPPIMREPKCQVCVHPHRAWIELQLVKGAPYLAIEREIPDLAEHKKPSRKSIANHSKEHMPIDRAMVRAELEEQADLIQQNYEVGTKGAITTRGMLNVIARKIYDDATKGIVTGEIKDLIQLVKITNEMNANQAEIRNEENEAMMRTFLKAIKNVCSEDIQLEIGNEVRRLRTEDKIAFKMENALQPELVEATVTDAEVV